LPKGFGPRGHHIGVFAGAAVMGAVQAQRCEDIDWRRHHDAPRATDRAPIGRELRPVAELDGKLGDPGEIEDDGERPVMRGQGAGGRVQVDGYLPGEDAGERRQQYLVGLDFSRVARDREWPVTAGPPRRAG
jgi:hypothetical protein